MSDRAFPRRDLVEFFGQESIVGPGKLLRRAIEADRLFPSIILWGPPGTGKTTLGMCIANQTKSHFETLSAVLAGKPELRVVIDAAIERRKLYQKKTILFVDVVHRWNKAQQDALLPHVENGTITLIGATTESLLRGDRRAGLALACLPIAPARRRRCTANLGKRPTRRGSRVRQATGEDR